MSTDRACTGCSTTGVDVCGDALQGRFATFLDATNREGEPKIKTIGDAYMVAAGLPAERPDHAQAADAMALDMLAAVKAVADEVGEPGGCPCSSSGPLRLERLPPRREPRDVRRRLVDARAHGRRPRGIRARRVEGRIAELLLDRGRRALGLLDPIEDPLELALLVLRQARRGWALRSRGRCLRGRPRVSAASATAAA
jgi:hypothetical protein